jgi:hypothetical protein
MINTKASDPFWAVRNWPQLSELIAQELRADLPHSQWRIASDDRALLAQIQMSLRLKPGYALGWQRKGTPDNHFDQHFPLTSGFKEPVLLVTKASREDVIHHYPQAIWVKEVISDQMPLDALTYQLWWLNK